MAITNGYAPLADLKTRIGISDTVDDPALERAIEASSRAIDDHTGRRFWVDVALGDRHYDTDCERRLRIQDVSTLTGVVVKIDRDGDGVYEETLAATTDYVLTPLDAAVDGEPFTELMLINRRLPRFIRPGQLQVTATHGWPGATVTAGIAACPVQVKEACLLVAHRHFRRRDTPEGVAGTIDTGVIRISKYEDPDAVRLLRGFVSGGQVLVA